MHPTQLVRRQQPLITHRLFCILVYVSCFTSSSCCGRVVHLRGQWPGAGAFPWPGRQDWGRCGDWRQGKPSDSVARRAKDHRRRREGLRPQIGETDEWAAASVAGWAPCFSNHFRVMTSSGSGEKWENVAGQDGSLWSNDMFKETTSVFVVCGSEWWWKAWQ